MIKQLYRILFSWNVCIFTRSSFSPGCAPSRTSDWRLLRAVWSIFGSVRPGPNTPAHGANTRPRPPFSPTRILLGQAVIARNAPGRPHIDHLDNHLMDATGLD